MSGAQVVGLGLCTPVGTSTHMTLTSLRVGLVRFTRTEVLDEEAEPVRASRLSLLDDSLSRTERMVALARQALTGVRPLLASLPSGRVPLYLGLPEAGLGAGVEQEALVEALLAEAEGRLEVVKVHEAGRAAFFEALASAQKDLHSGRAGAVALVGAVDSLVDGASLAAHVRARLHLGRRNPDGRIPGEAAGFVALARPGAPKSVKLEATGVLQGTALCGPRHAGSGPAPDALAPARGAQDTHLWQCRRRASGSLRRGDNSKRQGGSMSKVYANGRSIIHKGSGNTHTSAAPDVCKVPTPGGPVPTPFVNSAQDSMLTKGSKSVTINGHPVALTDSELSVSSGNEPGTAGGLISSKFKGKMAWGSGSVDVKIEGKGVVRFLDVTLHNGNSFNTAFMSNGHNGTGFAYADDFAGTCIICRKDPDSHAVIERQETEEEQSLAIAKKILKDLREREKDWAQVNQEIITKEAHLKRLLEGTNPAPKQATLDARRAEIQGLEAKRKEFEDHRRADSSGYMFGVMVCRNGKKFAAVSGGELPPRFKAIAEGHGCTVIGKAATLEDFLAINPRCAVGDTEAIDKMRERWRETETLVARKAKGYNNKPGSCAGAKLIGKSGHVANSMTEMYFAFPSAVKKAYPVFYRGPSEYSPPKENAVGPDGKGAGAWKPPTVAAVVAALKEGRGGELDTERVTMRRKSEETVPSCLSCQDTLFMARCDLEVQKCG